MKNFFSYFDRIWNVLKYSPSNRNYLLLQGFIETVKLTFLSCFISSVLGFLLAVYLYLLKLQKNNKLYFLINFFINIILSTPYLMLIILIINHFLGPYFRCYYGFKAAFFCLSFILIFVFARNCEHIFLQINTELYQTAYTLGANKKQFIQYFLLTEARVFIVVKLISLFISSLAYSSVLHIVGQGGLSNIIYIYGWNNSNINFKKSGFEEIDLILVSIIIIFLLVQIVNLIGNFIIRKLDKTR
ncbi:ABC transporter permease subunit [Columbia Basin potato purple top phytoplasma]|uniref:ABC transporter permease subunit n=1 Tax=Columbia Basin potato purple top phytoplasma TaxID=307134 RepID=A0ABT5L9F2_9MOLU|nr:ABC transporter permease subunit [Columbia Basin potato purple top phytoplasma]MDC9032142.1 ABC transporter permease subunit [Columbia Basin potato purple top phytoplasma]